MASNKLKKLKKQKGFTLAEILVAISISILVIGTAYFAYLVGNKSFKSGSDKTELTQNIRIGLNRLTRELRETEDVVTPLPPDQYDPGNPPTNEITFQDANYQKIRYITYYISSNDLMRKVDHYYLSSDPSNWVLYSQIGADYQIDSDEAIISNVSSLQFYGQSLITIEISGQLKSESIDMQTKIYPRNTL